MDNDQILLIIVEKIKDEMKRRNFSQNDLAEFCEKKCKEKDPKSKGVSQSTISNIFKKTSSLRLSTLLKVCDCLDLNLFAIFRSINNSLATKAENMLIFDIKDPAFRGYISNMFIYFLSTNTTESTELVYGELEIGDFYHSGECIARLKIDANQNLDNSKPDYKCYEGNMVIYHNESLYLHMISNDTGDTWSLVFNHGDLNKKELACSFGCAATLSSGKNTRYPTIHFACLCNKKLSAEKASIIKNRLKSHNKSIFITKKNLDLFLQQETLLPAIRQNLEQIREKEAAQAYVIEMSALTSYITDPNVSYDAITRLLGYSNNETAFHIKPEEDTRLYNSLQ